MRVRITNEQRWRLRQGFRRVFPWPGSTSLYVANEKGFFKDEGLDVSFQVYPSGHLALADMLDDKSDLATATETPIARAALNGRPVAVAATIAEISRGIELIARKERGIARVEDLKGKTVGVTRGSNAEFFLHVLLTTSLLIRRMCG